MKSVEKKNEDSIFLGWKKGEGKETRNNLTYHNIRKIECLVLNLIFLLLVSKIFL